MFTRRPTAQQRSTSLEAGRSSVLAAIIDISKPEWPPVWFRDYRHSIMDRAGGNVCIDGNDGEGSQGRAVLALPQVP